MIESGLQVCLIVEETTGCNRVNEPVSAGIPFPQGTIFEPSQLSLWDKDAKRLPLQGQVLSRWCDGSAKWVLLDFHASVDPSTQTIYHIRGDADGKLDLAPPKLSVVQTAAQQVVVDTGGTVFFLNPRVCKPFDRVVTKGMDLIAHEGSSLALIDPKGREHLPCIDDLAIEVAGPLRTTIRVRGALKTKSGNSHARFVVRLNFHAGSGCVEMKMTLHNPKAARHTGGLWDLGDEGSIYFKDLSLQVRLREQNEPAITWSTQPFQKDRPRSVDCIEIYQDSSGGENWRSTNHVNRFGKVMHSFCGYRVKSGDALAEEGVRATPTAALHGEQGGVAGAIEKFWENFPKAIEVDRNSITMRLFPCQYNDLFELQGGEQKTHTVYLQFYGPGEKQPALTWVHDRLIPRATPDWYSKTKACGYLSPRPHDHNTKYLQLIDTAIDGPQSFFTRREIIDEYGWRHFGDLYADHEAVGHTGETPLVAHYNNQYDVVYGAIAEYLRGGNPRWLELASDLARHVIDIDIYHTCEDRAAYNGGLFWHTDHYLDAGTGTHRTYSKAALKNRDVQSYGGGPSNEQNYTSGLLHYYYLTGDEMARDAVLSLADWVLNMDDGSHRPLGFIDNRPTGLCSSTVSRDYHGPGRGAGNSINSLLDAYVLTRDKRYLLKAEELIRRCIHPKDDIASRNLDGPEHRWSYLVFLQAIGKYLDVKIENNELDFMYCYAQASLLHYAEWMIAYEVPYSTVLDKVEIPTETWPAQDVRKSAVFHVAAKHAAGPIRGALQERADFFFEQCIKDLSGWKTCTLTRPLALLLGTAYVHTYFQQHRDEAAPQPMVAYDFGRPTKFSPQFQELFRARQKLSAWVGKLNKLRQAGRSFLCQNKTDLEMRHG
jgi:YetA-like protein